MIANILVCLDGTAFSESMLPLAAEIAERFQAKTTLLKVIAMPYFIKGVGKAEVTLRPQTEVSAYEQEIDRYLEHAAEPFRDKRLDYECVVIEGAIEESIITFASTYNIDLIALATHGRGGLGRLFSGSTTESVLRKSGIPVLAVCPSE
jgi:nucleotide-binding universal stress UspA family protein